MRLKKVHVKNFRSVDDSLEFEVDHTTCLVGKNEAGKTAVLQALAGLNPHSATPIKYDKERDYPSRYLTRYSERHPDKAAVVVRTRWIIEDDEAESIADQFGDALTSREVQILRRYDADTPEWKLPIDFAKGVQQLISDANFSASEKSQIASPSNTQTLRKALESIDNPAPKHQKLLERINGFPEKTISGKIRAALSSGFPKFMYFSNYDRMSGQVRMDQLQQRRDSGELFTNNELRGDRLFFEFLEHAGAPVDEILTAATYESFSAKLQGASNAITDQILDYWSQNPYINVTVKVDTARPEDSPPFDQGVVGRARIFNTLHRADVPFSERSAGFIWFFSFLIKFAQVKKDGAPVILLLDEPGLTLHGKAQADLLRYFDQELAPHHQILYTTHSPFMVPPDNLTSVRIVEDLVDTTDTARPVPIGTKVRDDVLNTDPDSIFPLQGALGYEITQTLFIGKHTLLVEGPSDILYMKALSAALARRHRTCLEPKWVICPAGGMGNIRPFVSLFRGNELNVVALSDYAKGDKRKVESLRASQVLRAGAVLTMDQFTDKTEADTEDLFESDLFVDLLNQAYELTGKNKLTVAKLDAADAHTPRLVKKAEAYFQTLPEPIPVFDHFSPASWLIENPAFLDQDQAAVSSTLERAETLIEAINGMLVD